MKVTITIEDNALAGQGDQPDFTIFVSGEPSIDWGEDASLPDVETLPVALLAAIEMITHITGMTAEAAFVKIAQGSEN